MIQNNLTKSPGWLLFFYSLPSKPVGNRMKIWRKLSRIGAVSFKGSVYLLPDNEENHEYFQWLVSEVISRGGEGAFVRVERIESMPESELIDLFNQSREKDYRLLEDRIETLERGIVTIKKAGGSENSKKLTEDLSRLSKEFEAIRSVDFFLSKKGASLEIRIKNINNEIKTLSTTEVKKPERMIAQRNRKDYQQRIWVTRKRPYVDRMAAAWLIRKFIDKKAVFEFNGEEVWSNPKEEAVAFDMKNGEFTHQGDLCTFEVLIKAFGLKDEALDKMAEIVHEIDLKDEKHRAPEAKGVEEILKGIRKTIKDDGEVLEKGMALFEMLYASKTL
jgi:hypothetical protein